jgi:hypothetical protein
MRNHKIVLLVSFSLLASSFLAGQTLVSISGGLNLSKVIDNASNSSSDQVSDISGKLSYSILLEIKGRKPKKFHPGASIMFYQSSYDWYAKNSGYMADGLDINYKIEYLRFSVFPEFTLGNRFQFFCNLGPYLNFMVYSSKNGTSWSYKYINYYPRKVTEDETGSASEDIKKVDFGVQASVGMNCLILPWLGLTFQENCSFGFINVNKTDLGGKQRNFSLSFLLGVSFKVPANTSQDENHTVN